MSGRGVSETLSRSPRSAGGPVPGPPFRMFRAAGVPRRMPSGNAKEAVMAIDKGKKHDPVSPSGVELVFHYLCPRCRNLMRVVSPLRETEVLCNICATRFPVAPVDMALLKFVHVITAGGRAASTYD